jgi:hypothetical protein
MYVMIVFCDLFKISLVCECIGYYITKSVFKGYGMAIRLGTTDVVYYCMVHLYIAIKNSIKYTREAIP